MTAYINKLKDKTGNQQLPVTHERAVRDDNGTTLESKLQNLEGAMDKAYVASSDNGMGRITLKKNMVGGVNTLTQDMMPVATGGNTIYIIRYDFTLGEDITVPANCELVFEGGSISGAYTITGNKTNIVSNTKCFDSTVTFAGIWHLQTVYVDWFVGATINVDCSASILKAISLAKLARTSLTFGDKGNVDTKYFCTNGGFDVSNLTIYGNGSSIMFYQNTEGFIADGNLTIRDLTIYKYPYQSDTTEYGTNKAINITNNYTYVFDNVTIDGFRTGWYLNKAWNVNITNCITRRGHCGIYSTGLSVNNIIQNSHISAVGICIKADGTSEGWVIANNIITDANTGIRFQNHANSIIKNNIIDLCKVYCIELVLNCPGIIINDNYLATNDGGGSHIIIYAQNISDKEDQIISIKNNIIRCYGNISSGYPIYIPEGKYKHLNISGNHMKAPNASYGICITGNTTINTIYVRDNVVEGDSESEVPVSIGPTPTHSYVSDNVKLQY